MTALAATTAAEVCRRVDALKHPVARLAAADLSDGVDLRRRGRPDTCVQQHMALATLVLRLISADVAAWMSRRELAPMH